MCCQANGQFYLMSNNYKKAVRYFTESLENAKRVYGERDKQVAVLMSDTAAALQGLGEYEEAERMCQKALDMSLALPPPHDKEHIGTLLMNLAALKNDMGMVSSLSLSLSVSGSFPLSLFHSSLPFPYSLLSSLSLSLSLCR